MEINIDLITKLRYEGKNKEARQLLIDFRKSVEKEKELIRKEILAKDYRLKVKFGICTRFGCNRKAVKDRVECKQCIATRKNGKSRNN